MNGDSFRKNSRFQLDDNPHLKGLEAFKRSLEKDYFAHVSVRNCSTNKQNNDSVAHPWNLVIDIECNFDLIEVLFHLEKGSWGRGFTAISELENTCTPFYRALNTFRDRNSLEMDVEELSLILKDTTIVIKKIYNQSIGYQLGAILETLAAHYVHITKGLTETPYEIYLPVFEEVSNGEPLVGIRREMNSARDYMSFWALYFDSIPEAKIYDLQKKTIISGDLHMLNQ